ncbi:hypothetical protein NE237_014602 [Protea cynaroides]|uniref:Pectinesterase n=1 Tax=Protea cynaroides TaxID=273540 RepID=A0A9Q0KCD1_9MAGN|nr:hypothetical protein NE237_014602 [Protea cynaroides]
MTSKALIVSVSLILVVGIVNGAVVVGINHNGHSLGDKSLSTNMKAVEAICSPASFKDKCMSAIAPVAANSSASPKDYLRAVLAETIEAMKAGLETSHTIKIKNLMRYDQLALDECKTFIQYAVEDLQDALAMLDDNELHVVHDQVDEFKNWFGAVVAFQETCFEQIENPDLKDGIADGLHNATLLTINALDIFSELSTILVGLDIPLNLNPNHRKLLSVGHLDEHGYPHWLSEEDRRLLEDVALPVPDAIVSANGSGPGQFNTVADALASYPNQLPLNKKFVIYVMAGTYKEVNLTVQSNQSNVFMYGDGTDKTIITGDKNVKNQGIPTSQTPSFTVLGPFFVAKSIKFENIAGPEGGQAVALRVQADMSAFFRCKMEGYQDTLYAHTYRQFYRECEISGTIDFVFGMSSTVIQNSQIIVRKPLPNQQNVVSADGSNSTIVGGLVFQNCSIVPAPELLAVKNTTQTFLGRPWRDHATDIFMQSYIEDFIDPSGFMIWDKDTPNNETCFFAEYANTGPGARTDGRVNWTCHHVFTDGNALIDYTVGPFINNGSWLESTGIPFSVGF